MPTRKQEEDYMTNSISSIYDGASKDTGRYIQGSFFFR